MRLSKVRSFEDLHVNPTEEETADNILFDLPYVEERYKKTLEVRMQPMLQVKFHAELPFVAGLRSSE